MPNISYCVLAVNSAQRLYGLERAGDLCVSAGTKRIVHLGKMQRFGPNSCMCPVGRTESGTVFNVYLINFFSFTDLTCIRDSEPYLQ